MNLLWITKRKLAKDENGENLLRLEIKEVVLIHSDIVDNDYQQESRVLYTFVPNKSFGQLLHIIYPRILYFKILYWIFFILQYGLLIKILNHYIERK